MNEKQREPVDERPDPDVWAWVKCAVCGLRFHRIATEEGYDPTRCLDCQPKHGSYVNILSWGRGRI